MDEPRDWDEEYLLNLPIGEFDWLEAKGRQALDLTISSVKEPEIRENLSKAISAFANSGGGVLVLGLKNPKSCWQIDDGGIDLTIKRPNTREWLEDIIPTLVDVPLSSFNVYVVDNSTNSNSQITAGRGVFIIEIPDSEQAPHQAIDHRYYARVGGKSRPIGHRLVLDIFGRRQYPKIQLNFSIEAITYIPGDSFPFSTPKIPSWPLEKEEPKKKRRFELTIRAKNVGRVFAKYVNSFVYIPIALVPEDELKYNYSNDDFEEIDGIKYVVWTKSNTHRDLIKAVPMGVNQYGSSWFDPVLPGLSYAWEWDLTRKFDKSKMEDMKILWEVYADNAPMQSGSVAIREIEIHSKKEE